jgi:hypothetical protein
MQWKMELLESFGNMVNAASGIYGPQDTLRAKGLQRLKKLRVDRGMGGMIDECSVEIRAE